MSTYKICYTGGGSAGHIFPIFEIDKALKEQGFKYKRFWIGSHSDKEATWVKQNKIFYIKISSGKLRRYFSWQNFIDPFKVVVGFFQSLYIFKKLKPDLVFAKGGFVTVAPVWAAYFLKIETLIHESDTTLGLANRLCAPVATKIALPSEHALKNINKKYLNKCIVTGIPNRMEKATIDKLSIYKKYNLDESRAIITILGGSLGSSEINTLVEDNLESLTKIAQIVHQGEKDVDQKNYISRKFFSDDLPSLLKCSTLVISRAGATSINEYSYLKVPMFLIPLSAKSSRGDQLLNSQYLEQHRAAYVLKNKKSFIKEVKLLINDDILTTKLAENSYNLYVEGSDKKIASIIVKMIKREK